MVYQWFKKRYQACRKLTQKRRQAKLIRQLYILPHRHWGERRKAIFYATDLYKSEKMIQFCWVILRWTDGEACQPVDIRDMLILLFNCSKTHADKIVRTAHAAKYKPHTPNA